MLQEEDIVFLNKLRRNKPDAYKRKLRILGITDGDVPYREIKTVPKKTSNAGDSKLFCMGGKPYCGTPPKGFMPKPSVLVQKSKKERQNMRRPKNLYLIDGDNNFKEATKRLKLADDTDDVRIFVSQEGLYRKLKGKDMPHVRVTQVDPGPQAVDNYIKSILGNEVKNERYDSIFVISKDKGYEEKIQEYRCKYGKRKSKLDLRDMF